LEIEALEIVFSRASRLRGWSLPESQAVRVPAQIA